MEKFTVLIATTFNDGPSHVVQEYCESTSVMSELGILWFTIVSTRKVFAKISACTRYPICSEVFCLGDLFVGVFFLTKELIPVERFFTAFFSVGGHLISRGLV